MLFSLWLQFSVCSDRSVFDGSINKGIHAKDLEEVFSHFNKFYNVDKEILTVKPQDFIHLLY